MKKFAPVFLVFLFNADVLLSQVDTIPPVINAHEVYYSTVGIGYDSLSLSQVVDTIYDDQTSFHSIKAGMRIGCVGNDYSAPLHTILIRTNDYHINLEIWAKDEAGNMATVSVPVFINCFGCDPEVTFVARTPPLLDTYPVQGIHHMDFHTLANNCSGDTLDRDYNASDGDYVGFFGYAFPLGYDGSVSASKNNDPLNGVTTADLLLIYRHILGIEPLDSPYKIIAADANQDGKVTIYDVVLLRKLILGITDTLPNGKSWRFIPEHYLFPHPADPFQPPFPEKFEVQNGEAVNWGPYFFTGIKIGDVNFSADPHQ
jgi:Dockerin type I domain